jgi:DNA-binding transcriptional MerR regulator
LPRKQLYKKNEEVERRSILLMKKAGYSDKEIAQLLEDKG